MKSKKYLLKEIIVMSITIAIITIIVPPIATSIISSALKLPLPKVIEDDLRGAVITHERVLLGTSGSAILAAILHKGLKLRREKA